MFLFVMSALAAAPGLQICMVDADAWDMTAIDKAIQISREAGADWLFTETCPCGFPESAGNVRLELSPYPAPLAIPVRDHHIYVYRDGLGNSTAIAAELVRAYK